MLLDDFLSLVLNCKEISPKKGKGKTLFNCQLNYHVPICVADCEVAKNFNGRFIETYD